MKRLDTYDTTLRDGSQGEGVTFSLQAKLQITQKLDALGFDFIEGGYPLSNPKDFEYFEQVRDLDLAHSTVCAFGMTRRKNTDAADDTGMLALRDSQAKICTIVGKSWDLHVTEVLQASLEEHLAMIRDSVAFLVAEGRRVFYDAEHFFDGYRANPDYALSSLQAAAEAGAEILVLCDTNGGSLPEFITETIQAVRSSVDLPLGIHCHNDSDLATANTLAAVAAGAQQIQGTINGIGERCGNTDLIPTVCNLVLKNQYTCLHPESLAGLSDLSRFVFEMANMRSRNGQPFVGRSAFAHKGGMHVHAVNRLAKTYEHIDPALVGNKRRVLVSELSGRGNIAAATSDLPVSLSDRPELAKTVLARVQDLEAEGYQFESAEASFELLVKKAGGMYQPKFKRVHYRVNAEANAGEVGLSEASVKIEVQDRLEYVVAEGSGPVNALDKALRKALIPVYPSLSQVRLVDYKVRVIDSVDGTAARVRVLIESADENSNWTTIGVSNNLIEASWIALVDSVEFKLLREDDATAEQETSQVVNIANG